MINKAIKKNTLAALICISKIKPTLFSIYEGWSVCLLCYRTRVRIPFQQKILYQFILVSNVAI